MSLKQSIIDLLGKQSNSDNDLQKDMRHHQSWWRACVLGEEQGQHPIHPEKNIGSGILNGKASLLNFGDDVDAKRAVEETLKLRNKEAKGLIKEDRLYNNLLSSQPLCFNFFGRLKYNRTLATKVFQQFYPEIKTITDIHFEYAPNAATNGDNSAHDVALEFVSISDQKGIIGLECKYTEPFSPKEYSSDKYKEIYCRSEAFEAPYNKLINTKYNQLFRNQLIVESAMTNQSFDIGYSGLFCFQQDKNALSKGKAFQEMLKNGKERFKIITFADLIETIQKTEIDWETREWSMLLWARYCGTELSKRFK